MLYWYEELSRLNVGDATAKVDQSGLSLEDTAVLVWLRRLRNISQGSQWLRNYTRLCLVGILTVLAALCLLLPQLS